MAESLATAQSLQAVIKRTGSRPSLLEYLLNAYVWLLFALVGKIQLTGLFFQGATLKNFCLLSVDEIDQMVER
ncbi:unnamed protein product [Clonostachys rhizophaga]|uniref:Uncharacterized protein n=1 Tax=Clonostachys rhizophaga TaxID=160324 RepID=A0A9N9YUP5_9HYPO|nr:unnamed protein product [Clonostachys rhizophaga]